jgi:DNA repair protein RadB
MTTNADKIMLPEPFHSLTGGIERGAITNFYGPPGVGKTNICILAALECIKNGGRVLYIDSEGGLSPERIMQISGGEDVLEKIAVLEPKTFEEQGVVIKNIESHAKDFGMIILDSAVALYRLRCADVDNETLEANKELSVQLSVLSNIARKIKIPVIITAHAFRNWDTGENRIIGGDAIKYWSKSIIFIEHTGKMSERKATIIKHRSMPEGKTVKFELVADGIKPAAKEQTPRNFVDT